MSIYTVEKINMDKSKTLLMASESAEDSARLAIIEASGFPEGEALVSMWREGKVVAATICKNTVDDVEMRTIGAPEDCMQFLDRRIVNKQKSEQSIEDKAKIYAELSKSQKNTLKKDLKEFNKALWMVEPNIERFGVTWFHGELIQLCK